MSEYTCKYCGSPLDTGGRCPCVGQRAQDREMLEKYCKQNPNAQPPWDYTAERIKQLESDLAALRAENARLKVELQDAETTGAHKMRNVIYREASELLAKLDAKLALSWRDQNKKGE